MRFILIFLLLIFCFSCSSEKENPMVHIIDSKSPDELFLLSGEKIIDDVCFQDKDIDSKCLNAISIVVKNLVNNGFDNVTVSNFDKSVLNNYLIKIDLSDSRAMAR